MLDLWVAVQEDVRIEDETLVVALDYASPLPWLEALVLRRPQAEREALVLAALRRLPAGDLRALTNKVDRPELVRGPWRYFSLAPTGDVAQALFDVVERVRPWDFPLAEVLLFLARLPEATLTQLERAGRRAMLRRARWVREGGRRTAEELAGDLRDWFREGVTLSSGLHPSTLAPPCRSCGAVLRAGFGSKLATCLGRGASWCHTGRPAGSSR
ncbi:MAG: hypothetical protein JNJ54_30320 [Myxococcaceae bacterium]|nr:hypothetical protein [Myxococcaceae bacterium]